MRAPQIIKILARTRHAVLLLMLVCGPVAAQEMPPVITADNIRHLHSIAQIDFADLPAEAGTVTSGWFAVSADGKTYAVVNRQNQIILWTLDDGLLYIMDSGCPQADGSTLPGAFVDGAFAPDGTGFAAVFLAGASSYIQYIQVDAPGQGGALICDIPGAALRLWLDDTPHAWVELLPADYLLPPSVQAYSLIDAGGGEPSIVVSSGPENDAESFARIGRIESPLAITVTQETRLKRWHLATGNVTETAQLGALPGIGQVNYGGVDEGRYFVWVNNRSETLNLLDFATGTNRQIVSLSGTEVPFLWLASGADVAIGVNVGLESGVTGWILDTGETLDLGSYRACNRLPDMVRLSRDGTTLVTGCDTGLDIWRVGADRGT